MQGHPLGVGGHRQQDLRSIRTMVAAVSVAAQLVRPFAFEVHAAQIIEQQADPRRESVLIEPRFQSHPLAVEQIHRGIKVVFVERFLGRQAADLGQRGAFGLLAQGQLGAGKQQPAQDHRFD